MFSSGCNYIKPYVHEFDRVIRLYLDDEEYSTSYISTDLIKSIDPSIIQEDYDGNNVFLNLIFKTYNANGVEDTLTVNFEV